MRELVVASCLTFDGVMEAPGGGDHPHAGWTFTDVPYDEEAYEAKEREQRECGGLLMGRVTYEEFAPVWHTMEDSPPTTRDRSTSSPPPSRATPRTGGVRPDEGAAPLDDVAALKEGEGGLFLVHGSARLAESLAAADLVDRYHLLVFPVPLGSGKRLFGDQPKRRLAVAEARTYANGIIKLVHDVAR